jgi:DNA-binding CsgD family transcriptional regulator
MTVSIAPESEETGELPQALSARDRALALRAQGATLEDVATELGLKRSTAARFVRLGMSALGVRSQAELIIALRGREGPLELPDVLTPAERDVVSLLLIGKSNREIAIHRGTATRTVANQLQGIYYKLTVGSRGELVARLSSLEPAKP